MARKVIVIDSPLRAFCKLPFSAGTAESSALGCGPLIFEVLFPYQLEEALVSLSRGVDKVAAVCREKSKLAPLDLGIL